MELQCLLWDLFFSPFDLHSSFLTHNHGGTANSIVLLNWDPGDLLELKNPDPPPYPRAELRWSPVYFSASRIVRLVFWNSRWNFIACKWMHLAVGATDDLGCSQYYISVRTPWLDAFSSGPVYSRQQSCLLLSFNRIIIARSQWKINVIIERSPAINKIHAIFQCGPTKVAGLNTWKGTSIGNLRSCTNTKFALTLQWQIFSFIVYPKKFIPIGIG